MRIPKAPDRRGINKSILKASTECCIFVIYFSWIFILVTVWLFLFKFCSTFQKLFRLISKVMVCRLQSFKPGCIDSGLYVFCPKLLVFAEIISKTFTFWSIQPAFHLVHVWRYSPIWSLASLKRCLHFSLPPVRLLQDRIPRICNASLGSTSFHLIIGFPTGLMVWNFPLRITFKILSSSILMMWPTHRSHLISVSSTVYRSE